MILNEFDAKVFLESDNGKILMHVRAERDWLANHVKVWTTNSRSKLAVDDMVGQESEWAGYAQLISHFAENHRWQCCQQVEALKLLCTRVARLERGALTRQ